MTKQLITPEMKLLALQYVEEEFYSIREICEKYAISTYTFKSWRTKFKTGGIEALTPAKKNKFYSKELKERAVADYLTKNIRCTKSSQHMKLAVGRCSNHG